MIEPRLKHVQCLDTRGLHRMAYWEWGDASNEHVLVCAHGLTRQGRDFDTLARRFADPLLEQPYRVVCIDVAGRGQSDWLADPMGYAIPAYVADVVSLFARLNVEQVDWIGTSMGGLIGLGFASLPRRGGMQPVRKLVLNDVGPTINPEAITRIGSYVGQPMRFESIDAACAYLAGISAGFGSHSRERWLELSKPMLKAAADGSDGWVLHYDPAIAQPFKASTPEMAAAGEALLWHAYDSLKCPTLLLRGADSDLLSRETAAAMASRGPKAQVHEVGGVGHAPMLVEPEQIDVIERFLLGP